MAQSTESNYFAQQKVRLALWVAPLVGPMAWFTDLQFSFSFDRWACDHNNIVPLYLLTALCTLLAASGAAWSWSHWKHARPVSAGEQDGVIPRTRFLSLVSLAVNLLFTIAVVAQAIPKLMLNPCQ